MRGSMHELNKQFLRPSSPSGSQKSSRYTFLGRKKYRLKHQTLQTVAANEIFIVKLFRSKNSTRSKKSNKSNTSTRRSKSRKTKERSRTNSGSHSRNASRTSKKHRERERSNSSEDSEDFFTGESDEEFVSISSNSDKAPRVSWTCEHCTYVNNPGVKVRCRDI